MNLRFDEKTVLVTGAAHGFGRAIAQSFASLGATVWGCDLEPTGLDETRAGAVGRLEVRTCDVTDPAAVRALVAEAGVVDVLVNNAGGVLGQAGRPLEEVTSADWNAVLAVNLSAAFYCAQAVSPAMKARGSGRIVNIASGAGLGPSLTGIQAYASAKAGLVNLTRQLCHELGPFGVTVNCVAPGFVRSNPTTERQWQGYGKTGQRRLLERIALRRLGSPEDIADAVVFFASDRAGWVSGQVLAVDGGK